MRPVLGDKLRHTPGCIEQLESEAAHPEDATEFSWTNPTDDNEKAL
ncbi:MULTISPECIES: hypothetical protein [unclassified Mycobacteroides]|nr:MULTISPECIES: hypothetical protein [unclassified Mycobacteroides]